jgi:hypothetical protein
MVSVFDGGLNARPGIRVVTIAHYPSCGHPGPSVATGARVTAKQSSSRCCLANALAGLASSTLYAAKLKYPNLVYSVYRPTMY